MRRILLVFLAGLIFVVPFVVSAQTTLVPCDGPECQACHVVELGQNIINFLIQIAAFIAVLIFSYAGFIYVTAGGDTGKIGKAHGMFTNVALGIVIVLAGWLIVDTVMKYAFVGSELAKSTFDTFGPWNQLNCVTQELRNPNPGQGRVTVGGGTDATLSDAEMDDRIARTDVYKNELCQKATAQGIGDQCARLQAIVAVESDGDPTAVSGAGAIGLMQILPDTARTLDSSLRGKSDREVIDALKDPTYNMDLGVRLYARDYDYYGGDTTKTTAAFNGGRGANGASQNCDGQLRWQCEWDDDAHTVPNEGYEETRNYVSNIDGITSRIQGR